MEGEELGEDSCSQELCLAHCSLKLDDLEAIAEELPYTSLRPVGRATGWGGVGIGVGIGVERVVGSLKPMEKE